MTSAGYCITAALRSSAFAQNATDVDSALSDRQGSGGLTRTTPSQEGAADYAILYCRSIYDGGGARLLFAYNSTKESAIAKVLRPTAPRARVQIDRLKTKIEIEVEIEIEGA